MSSDDKDVRAAELVRRLVYVGFNSRVVALDQLSGEIIWQWKSPKGTAPYVALLLDGSRLIASVQGYTYCLDALTGELLWNNPLKGLGMGIPSLTSTAGNSSPTSAAAAAVATAEAVRNAAAGRGGV